MPIEPSKAMHTFKKAPVLLAAPFLAAALAAHAATLPSEDVDTESNVEDVLSAAERDDFEQFMQERREEETQSSEGSFEGAAGESNRWSLSGSSGTDSWSGDTSATGNYGESYGGTESIGGATAGSGFDTLMDFGGLVSDPEYSAPERPSPASSVVEEFSGIGRGSEPTGGTGGGAERYGSDFDPFDYSSSSGYSDPFAPSDSDSSSGPELGWISERNAESESAANSQRHSFETQVWTSRSEASEANTFAPSRDSSDRSRPNATPDYLLD